MNPVVRAIAAAALGLACMQASASSVTFTDRSTWEASTSNIVNRDFEGYAGNGSHLGTFTDNGVTFSSSNNYIFTWGPSSGYNIGSGKWILGPWNNGNLGSTILASGTTSVGTDLALYTGGGTISVFVNMLNGPDFSASVSVPGSGQRAFFGVETTDDSIVSLTFQSTSDDNVIMDNFATGAAPEPGMLGLLGLGLAGLGWSRRRQKAA